MPLHLDLHCDIPIASAACALQAATPVTPEIWNITAWQPAFAKLVNSYSALVDCTHSPDKVQASMYDALLKIVAVDLKKRFAGNLVFAAYVDDILLEQCNHDHGASMESLRDIDRGLCNTFVARMFQKTHTKWVACLCCAYM